MCGVTIHGDVVPALVVTHRLCEVVDYIGVVQGVIDAIAAHVRLHAAIGQGIPDGIAVRIANEENIWWQIGELLGAPCGRNAAVPVERHPLDIIHPVGTSVVAPVGELVRFSVCPGA